MKEKLILTTDYQEGIMTIQIPVNVFDVLEEDKINIGIERLKSVHGNPSFYRGTIETPKVNEIDPDGSRYANALTIINEYKERLENKQEEVDKLKNEAYCLNDTMLAQKVYIKRLESVKHNYEYKVRKQQEEIERAKRVNKEVVDMAVEMTHFLFDRALNKED